MRKLKIFLTALGFAVLFLILAAILKFHAVAVALALIPLSVAALWWYAIWWKKSSPLP